MKSKKQVVQHNVKQAKIIGIRFNEEELERLSEDMKKAQCRTKSSYIKKKLFQRKTRNTLVFDKLNTLCQRVSFLMNIADTTWKTEQNWLSNFDHNQNFRDIFKSFKETELDALLEIQERQTDILSELKKLKQNK